MTISSQELAALETLNLSSSALKVADQNYKDSYLKIYNLAKYLQIALILIFFLIGCVITPMAFQSNESSQKINIFWLLTTLLGAHFLSLMLWAASQLRPLQSPHAPAPWFTVLLKRTSRLFGFSDTTLEQFTQLHVQAAVGRWHIGRVVHSVWASYLIGGLLSALLFLMTHQVQFVWETTLLTAADFQALTQAISTLPAWFGIPVPSLDDIASSQLGNAVQSDVTRKTWAIWVLSCIFIYGVAIRLILTLACHLLYRQKRTQLWQSLATKQGSPARAERSIIDEDTKPTTRSVEPQPSAPVTQTTTIELDQTPVYLFEWSREPPKALTKESKLFTINDSAAQRAYLEDSNADRIIVIDASISPDRGSLRFMRQAKDTTQSFYLFGDGFVEDWANALQERGIASERITHLSDKG